MSSRGATPVLMFPGQGSQCEGMLERVGSFWPGTAAFLRECCAVLELESAWFERGFACNRDLQCAVFLTNHCYMRGLAEQGVSSSWSLGLSLGEYNHLVHIGALDVMDALRLVAQRGALYDAHRGGGMLVVFPIEREQLEPIVTRARLLGTIEIANFNSPRQFVLSGELVALEAAARAVEEEECAQSRFIDRLLPMHSSLFRPVASKLAQALAATPFRMPSAGQYLPNVLGQLFEPSEPDDMRRLLSRHVAEPVLWARSIDAVLAQLPDPLFIEVGPKTVLSDLLKNGWKGQAVQALDSPRARSQVALGAHSYRQGVA